jgi:hypothetical protein
LLVILIWRLGPQDILAALSKIGWYAALILPLYAAHHAMRALALRTCPVCRPQTRKCIVGSANKPNKPNLWDNQRYRKGSRPLRLDKEAGTFLESLEFTADA